MDEEVPSWVRRTKFSHTVCHRLDPSWLAAIPLTVKHNNSSPRHAAAATVQNSVSPAATFSPSQHDVQKHHHHHHHHHHPPFFDKQRSLSPLPQTTALSDTFKEARSSQKRFSTPIPQRKGSEKGRWSQKKEYHRSKTTSSSSSSISPSENILMQQQQFASMRINDKSRGGRKESTWAKYFDNAGGRVMAVEAEEWAVDMSKLLLGPKFAHGAHSRLYHGIYMDDPVAVKIIRVPDDDGTGSLAARLEKQFTREVALLSHMHHQNVINFVAACKNPPVYCIITEYLSVGSLRAYLHKLEHKLLPLEKLIGIATDIARGMEYVHSQGVIHRDLKPENVLINKDFHMKIADFGIACDAAYCDTLAEDPGTYRWMAPEMIKRSKYYGRKVDVYSFGLILWELVAGTIPYEDMTPIQAAYAVLSKNLRPSIPAEEGCPAAMRALIEQCWSNQAEKRPEFWQIVKVLEEFETALARDGTLNLAQIPTTTTPSCTVDHKKGLRHWIHKLGPAHHNTSHMPKPKFS